MRLPFLSVLFAVSLLDLPPLFVSLLILPPTDLTESVVTSSSSTNQTVPSCAVDESISKRYGKHNIRATRVHEGTGHRVQQVLKRLEAGEKVKVGVIGGSGAFPFLLLLLLLFDSSP